MVQVNVLIILKINLINTVNIFIELTVIARIQLIF